MGTGRDRPFQQASGSSLIASTAQNYRTAENEKIFQAVAAERLRPGDVFYGLGANIGTQELTQRAFSSKKDVRE
jgi:hypothetical protein